MRPLAVQGRPDEQPGNGLLRDAADADTERRLTSSGRLMRLRITFSEVLRLWKPVVVSMVFRHRLAGKVLRLQAILGIEMHRIGARGVR